MTIYDKTYIVKARGGTNAKFDVEFYETAEGDQPAREFMLSLDRKMRAKKYRADYLSRREDRK